MNRFPRLVRSLLTALASLLLIAAAAQAAPLGSRELHTGAHGADVAQLQRALVRLGYRLSIDGQYGAQTRRAVRRYERARGMTLDGRVTPREARLIVRAAARVREPRRATGGTEPTAAQPVAPASGSHAFPIAGPYSFGTAANRFGAARSGHTHQGQDVLAAEGTPLVSASTGIVHWRAYQSGGAGYYVVIRGDDGFDYVYMHLREAASVAVGERITAGQPIGHVGHTGAAEGSHLHFELWQGPWQAGGRPVDPLPYLESWQR